MQTASQNPVVVLGNDHPIAPYLVTELLGDPAQTVLCLNPSKHAAAKLESALRALNSEADFSPRVRLHVVPGTAAGADEPGGGTLYWFASGIELEDMLGDAHQRDRFATHMQAVRARAGRISRLCCILDTYRRPAASAMRDWINAVSRALEAATRGDGVQINVIGLGACVGTPRGGTCVDTGTPLGHLCTLTREVYRRVPAYFATYPITLREIPTRPLRVMTAGAAARQIGLLGRQTDATHSLVVGAESIRPAHLLEAMRAKTVTASSSATQTRTDTLFAHALDGIDKQAQAEQEWLAAEDIAVHPLPCTPDELDGALQGLCAQSALQNSANTSAPAPLVRHARPDLKHTLYGSGPETLLLINAFGLSMEFWQDLIDALGHDFRVLVIERIEAAPSTTAKTYYGADDFVADYLNDVRTVLDHEAIERCHVVSWCSGAKLAFELAHALRARIISLSLIAPSFAGVEGFPGVDSEYEKHLHTMCKIVKQTPQGAPTIAKTMVALLEKNAKDIGRFVPGQKNSANIFEVADATHNEVLYRPFSSPEGMIAFARQLLHFRQHDIRPLLGQSTLDLPTLLLTGTFDTATSSIRAKAVCAALPNILDFEFEGGSHYLLHQNADQIVRLLTPFIQHGLAMRWDDSRFRLTR